MASGRKTVDGSRLNLLLSKEERKLLDAVSSRAGLTKTDTLMHALRIYDVLMHERGKKVWIEDRASRKTRVLLV